MKDDRIRMAFTLPPDLVGDLQTLIAQRKVDALRRGGKSRAAGTLSDIAEKALRSYVARELKKVRK